VDVTRSLSGIFGPETTPFDADDEIDLAAFAGNVRSHLESGFHGVVICGSTGEAALLDERERAQLIEAARREVPDEKWLIAGTGAESTRACVRRCREVSAEGADAALVVAPHYYSAAMSFSALSAHYERVADESPVPVILYNIPKYMHFRLEPDLVARLAEHENIVGMKDSAGDVSFLERYLASQSDSFAVITGHAGTFLRALELGARGGILAAALFAPELVFELWNAFHAGRAEEAADAQRRLGPLASEVVARMGVPGVKAAMDQVGLTGGPVRLPLLPLESRERPELATLLRDASVVLAS
jgi:4-hydroxy-2-oxoglutarate aldolase